VRDRVLALALIVALPLAACQPSGELIGRTLTLENEAVLSDESVTRSIGDFAQGDQRILLNFWGSWCVPCREEIPLLATYAASASPEATVLGVLYKDSAGPGAVAAAELGATWESLVDADGSIAAQIPVNAAPLTLLLDSSGSVLDYKVGPFATLEEIKVFVAGH
jgi:thiol-disulfide isomerase/thioredoxin